MSRIRVMLVEDEIIIATDVKRTLEKLGYEVPALASSGEKAIELVKSIQPDLILMDIVLKGKMDGIDVAHIIRRRFNIPIIFLTAYADDTLLERVKKIEPFGYLIKPFEERELYFAIEMALYRYRAQEVLIKQKDQFVAVLIHDLKAPLIPIIGYAKRMLDGKINTEEKTKEVTRIILNASEDILKTIEKTSMELKEKFIYSSFDQQEVEINKLLTSVVMNCLPEAENRGIEIYVNNSGAERFGSMDNVVFYGDPKQLKCMIENLIVNALKYARKTIKVELSKELESIKLSICDDGPGIPEIYRKKIFEEYFQVPGSKKGTGLGLYSVKRIVENHNGAINVICPEGGGTIFEVSLETC